MEREAVLVGIDVGTTKVTALIGEVGRDGATHDHRQGHGPDDRPEEGRRRQHRADGPVDRRRRRAGRAAVGLEDRPGLRRRRRPARREPELARRRSRSAATAARSPARTSTGPPRSPGRCRSRRTARSSTSCRAAFIVDGQEGVKDPLGMSAIRLEVETHIVTGSATAVQNLTKCVIAGGRQDRRARRRSRSPRPRRSCRETEKELGVAVADIGAGTIDLALFADGSPFHTSVLPVGGNNVTMDIATVMKTSLQVAEELKISHGTCDLRGGRPGRADQRRGPRRGGRPDGQPARAVPDHRGPDARDVRAAGQRDEGVGPRDAARPGSS